MANLCTTFVRRGAALSSHFQFMGARCFSVVHGDINKLAPKLKKYVEENIAICQPAKVHICDGSEQELVHIENLLVKEGVFTPLKKYERCWITRTDPADVARVESKTLICSADKHDTIPEPAPGVDGKLGKWLAPSDMDNAFNERFPGCMKGLTMYVIPYSMGPIGSPLSKIGVQLSDSAYVVASMRIMTRIGTKVLEVLGNEDFVKCLHSTGQPMPRAKPPVHAWPCDPSKTIIAHVPSENAIISYGSGYGGNSLLGKKCFSLRIGSILAKREGWLAEHMLILGITNPQGKKFYVAAAFPSQCGKTNLALMNPTLPGYKIECVGDDICWMRFDDEGKLRAINPEAGFFGVAPGTSHDTNPNAMDTVLKNTIFTNIAETDDGGFYWEGLEKEIDLTGKKVTDWHGNPWTPGSKTPAAHPNSRFCTPASQCPIMDPEWESPRGVPISAILFGGRRPKGVPLVYEAFNWQHGVFVGASMRSEATSAAEHKGKEVMHDPFAMRPFFGYNFGKYLEHWLSMTKRPKAQLPRIFHVNWFRKDAGGKFIWPGFGENTRVLEWILNRVDGQDVAQKSAIGYIPKDGSININGLGDVDMKELFHLPKDFWQQECVEIEKYFKEQLPKDLPEKVGAELNDLKKRVSQM